MGLARLPPPRRCRAARGPPAARRLQRGGLSRATWVLGRRLQGVAIVIDARALATPLALQTDRRAHGQHNGALSQITAATLSHAKMQETILATMRIRKY